MRCFNCSKDGEGIYFNNDQAAKFVNMLDYEHICKECLENFFKKEIKPPSKKTIVEHLYGIYYQL